MDRADINAIVHKFFMALIWGFGAPLTSPARPKYSMFLHEVIHKVFDPNECSFEFKKPLDIEKFPQKDCNLFSIFYHTQDKMWHRWDY